MRWLAGAMVALAAMLPAPAHADQLARLTGHALGFGDRNDNIHYRGATVDVDIVIADGVPTGTAAIAIDDDSGSQPAVEVAVAGNFWTNEFPPRGLFQGLGTDGSQYLFVIVDGQDGHPDEMLVRRCGGGNFQIGAYFGCGLNDTDADGLNVLSGGFTYQSVV